MPASGLHTVPEPLNEDDSEVDIVVRCAHAVLQLLALCCVAMCVCVCSSAMVGFCLPEQMPSQDREFHIASGYDEAKELGAAHAKHTEEGGSCRRRWHKGSAFSYALVGAAKLRPRTSGRIASVFLAARAAWAAAWNLNVARGVLRLVHWHAGVAFGVALCLGLCRSCDGVSAPPRSPCMAPAAL